MPVHVEKRGARYRIIEADGKIATTPNGRPRDGGGHRQKRTAMAQMRAINAKGGGGK